MTRRLATLTLQCFCLIMVGLSATKTCGTTGCRGFRQWLRSTFNLGLTSNLASCTVHTHLNLVVDTRCYPAICPRACTMNHAENMLMGEVDSYVIVFIVAFPAS